MKITRLEKSQRELVLALDPVLMLDRLEMPGSLALVAAESETATGDELPVGLLIATKQSGQLTIDWLYVMPGHRMQGVGEQLLVTVFEHAAQTGIPRLCAYFNEEYGRREICNDEKAYFREHLFVEEQVLGGEWMTDVRTLAAQPPMRGQTEAAVAFRKLNVTQAEEAIGNLLSREYCETLYPVNPKERYFDPDLSFLLWDGETVRGGLLVQRMTRSVPYVKGQTIIREREEVLYPVLCCAPDDAGMQTLAAAACKSAFVRCDHGTEVRILLKNSRYAGGMNRLLPGQGVNNWLLCAQVKDYLYLQENDSRELGQRRLLQLG